MPAFSPTRPTSLASRTSAPAFSARNAALIAVMVWPGRSTEPEATACCSIGRIDHVARRTAGPLRQPLAEPPDLAGILDQREARRAAAPRRRPRHRSPPSPRGPTAASPSTRWSVSSPMARCLPSRTTSLMSPNTKRSPATVPERLATSSASPVTRPVSEALGKCGRRILFRDGVADALREFVAERDVLFPGEVDKTVGEIGIVGGQRRLDILGDERGVIPQSRIELQVGQLGRIVLRRQDGKGVPGMRPQQRERHGDTAAKPATARTDPRPFHPEKPSVSALLKMVCRFSDTTAPTKEGLLWDDKIVSNLHEQMSGRGSRNQPLPASMVRGISSLPRRLIASAAIATQGEL